jgi:ribonucleoside-diphosphate reductase alpha chain
MAEPSGKKMDNLYKLAWVRGLKTTYYLRSMGATGAEKTSAPPPPSAVEKPAAPAAVASVAPAPVAAETSSAEEDFLGEGMDAPKACSILEPDCEACQ